MATKKKKVSKFNFKEKVAKIEDIPIIASVPSEPSKMLKIGRVDNMSDTDYHAQLDSKLHFYSSSQLKTMLESPLQFKKKYITQEIPKEESPAFVIGRYFHSLVLEPHKTEAEFVIFEGTRRGAAWIKFQEDNSGKEIIKTSDSIVGQKIANALMGNRAACNIVHLSDKEVSFFWELNGVRVKIRTDCLFLGIIGSESHSFIADPKSTTGGLGSDDSIRKKVEQLNYDLSGALYIDVVNSWIRWSNGTLGTMYKEVTKFILLFACKKTEMVACRFMTDRMIQVGRTKYQDALENIKFYESINWHISEDIVSGIDSSPWEVTKFAEDRLLPNFDQLRKEYQEHKTLSIECAMVEDTNENEEIDNWDF